MKKIKQSFLAILLVLCFLALNVSTTVASAVESDIVYDESESDHEMLEATGSIEKEQLSPLVLESLDSAECMISKYVSADQFNRASHIERLYAEEELDTYVFLNSDGTKSVYYMDENVKFFDKNGDVKEKDISLVSKSDGYGIVRNEFDLHIPISATSGISMSYNGYEVKITPQSTARTAPARQAGETVVYDGFFGTNTSLVYTPMLSGIKEDVIMKAYMPNAEFSFVLDTDGLGLYNNDEGYYLAESESSEVILELGKVIIYDAIGKPDYGTMNVTTVTANQKYILSLSAPEEFLTDPTTVYPVTIDPTLTVSDTATGDGAIEDTVLFSNRPSKNYGDYKYLSIGYVDSTYGAGRVAVKLPGLYNSVEYQNITASEITSVKFYCRDSSGNSAQNINLYRITSAAWDENTVTYGDSVTYSTAINWGTSLPNGTLTAFDITTLVKGWKSGTYTASKGFILINPNETSASYKKVPYSSEYTTTSYRPYVVFTYDPVGTVDISDGNKTVDVKEGETCQLTASNTYQLPFVWESSNMAVATVSSTGMVTARKAGETTITASYIFNGGTYNITCTVYVYIDIGAFYIKNNNSNLYLNVQSGKINNKTNVQQYSKYSDSTSDITKLRQMWRIHHLGQGIYSLRPLHKLDMALDVTGTNADIYKIGSIDTLSSVPSYAEWKISWNSNGYVLKNAGSNSKTLQVENSSTISGSNVNVGTYTGGISQKWTLERISSPPKGVIMYDTNTENSIANSTKAIVTGETKTLADLNLVVVSYQMVSPGNLTSWSSSDSSIATVDANGTVIAKSCGTAIITASANGKSVFYTLTVIPIAEGTYYINNREKGGYIQIDDNASSNYFESGVHMEHHEFDGGDYQKWQFIHLSNGFYKIISVKSGLCLAVPSDGINESDVDIVQESYSNLPRKQWTVEPTTDGAFKIRNRAVTTDLVLCANAGTANGTNIQQDDYLDNSSFLDEWFLYTKVDYVSMYLGFNVGDPLMPPIVNAVGTALEDQAGMEGHDSTDLTTGQLLGQLSTTSIFSCITHGSPTSIKTSDGYLTVSRIDSLNESVFEDLKFVYLGACKTGKGREDANNLVNAIYEKGADTVLGFTISVNVAETNTWTRAFMIELASGTTIEDAMLVADEAVKNDPNITWTSYTVSEENRYLVGSDQMRPCR